MTDTIVEGWELVVGLEVHTELATETKIFCSCPNHFGDEPNTNVCPVCLGLPGSLPVLNRQVVELAIRLGEAVHCDVRPSIFHRKNYFYPDMPKDYQVSQYDRPINVGGYLDLASGHRVGITRAHLEEDTGKSTHLGGDAGGRIHGSEYSLVDYNRAGVPLLEIVSEPDIRTVDQARDYVGELRAILVATGVSDAKMEEGSMRVDANVSVRPPATLLGTRCEIKNLNSVRSLGPGHRVRSAPSDRSAGGGRAGASGDRGTGTRATAALTRCRVKEDADDYRYFPEPDLVPLAPDDEWLRSAMHAPPYPALPSDGVPVAAVAGRPIDDPAVVTAVERGFDVLAVQAVEAGGDPARVLVHVEQNLTTEAGAR